MTEYMSLEDFSRLYYGESRPKCWRQTVNAMCRDGWLKPFARKIGKKWIIERKAIDGR